MQSDGNRGGNLRAAAKVPTFGPDWRSAEAYA
jgi:hypothetical protein